MTLSAVLVSFIISTLLPLVTSLLTKVNTAPLIKQLVTAFLSAISGLITSSLTIDGTAVISTQSAILALGIFITASANYATLYRTHDINDKILPNKGI